MTTTHDNEILEIPASAAKQDVSALMEDAPASTATAAQAAEAIAKVQSGDFDIEQAREALSEKEFNSYVASLEGGDDINTDTLQAIASKLLKNTHKDVAKTKVETTNLAKTVAALQEQLAKLEKERADERAAASKAQQASSQDAVYSKLSASCSDLGVDLEKALGDAKTMQILRDESQSDDSPFTLLQAITAYNAKGKFAEAAKLVGEAVKRAGGEVKPVIEAPSESSAPAVAKVEKTYEQELSAVHAWFNASAKTFADMQERGAKLEALRKKHS